MNPPGHCSWRDIMIGTMAILVTLGFFAMLVGLMYKPIPDGNKEIMIAMTGVLGTVFVGAASFFFGTTIGAARQADTIRELAKPPLPPSG